MTPIGPDWNGFGVGDEGEYFLTAGKRDYEIIFTVDYKDWCGVGYQRMGSVEVEVPNLSMRGGMI